MSEVERRLMEEASINGRERVTRPVPQAQELLPEPTELRSHRYGDGFEARQEQRGRGGAPAAASPGGRHGRR